MDDTTKRADPQQEAAQEKKEYHTPEVREFGTVSELTQANSVSTTPPLDNPTGIPYITSVP